MITPSAFFKNRFFLDKTFKTNNIYSSPQNLHKSFTWLKNTSTVLSSFWFQLSYRRLFLIITALVFIILSLLVNYNVYIKFVFSNSLTPVYYSVWRVLDIFYFFILQVQYLFIVTVVTLSFKISNYIAATNFNVVSWMRKYHAEAPLEFIPESKSLENLNLNSISTTKVKLPSLENYYCDCSLLNFKFTKSFFKLVEFQAPSFDINLFNNFINFDFILKQNRNIKKKYNAQLSYLPSTVIGNDLLISHPVSYINNLIKATKDIHLNNNIANFFKSVRWSYSYNSVNRSEINSIESVLLKNNLNKNFVYFKDSFEWLLYRNSFFYNTLNASRIINSNLCTKTLETQKALNLQNCFGFSKFNLLLKNSYLLEFINSDKRVINKFSSRDISIYFKINSKKTSNLSNLLKYNLSIFRNSNQSHFSFKNIKFKNRNVTLKSKFLN